MTNCALVCEYNPFHSGHKYQLDCIRKTADNIICVMSGNFVQSGMPAFCDKSIRAECAIRGGANAVIELPVAYAAASAQYFAEGSARIISNIKDIKFWAMGVVSDKTELLRLADVKIKHADELRQLQKSLLDGGKGYGAATIDALRTLCGRLYPSDDFSTALTDANDILCLEYITAIDKFAANIEPLIIKRRGAAHGDIGTDSEYISATAIRTATDEGKYDSVKRFIPYMSDDIENWRKAHAPNISVYKALAVYAVKCATVQQLSLLSNSSEGIEYLLKKNDRSDYDELIGDMSTRRYGQKRLQRLMLNALLGIEKPISPSFRTRLLACRKNFDFSVLPSFVKADNAELKRFDGDDTKTMSNYDERAAALYNTLCGIDGGYYNYSLIKV